MNIVRWEPFGELEDVQRRINRMFGDAATEALFSGGWTPAVDIEETPTEYIVRADLPEVKKEEVKVEFQAGVLTLEGERKLEKEEKGKKFHKIERAHGRFVRRFSVPTEVDTNKVTAECKDGVLIVRLPKVAAAKPKAIEVKVA